ncbi:MAG: HEAT repeat domain-containing protein [Microcystaceae cyanobacterium]
MEVLTVPQSDPVTALIAAVEQADSAEKLVLAVQRLAALRQPEAIPTLTTVLRYNNPGAAVAAVDGLIALGETVTPYLLEHLDGYNYGARAWATRVFAGIGDPRALELLIEAAQQDFSLSVRRAAAQGLGKLRWSALSPEQANLAQQQVLATLGQVALDGEWVVRYAAIAGLQSLALGVTALQLTIYQQLQALKTQESEAIVLARIAWALQQLV